MNKFAIIEIGSSNTKTHIYEYGDLIYKNSVTIEFKKNYLNGSAINQNDIHALYNEISKSLDYTKDVYIYGCSIFRDITVEELNNFNQRLKEKFDLKLEVVSQEEEAMLTAYGCYSNIDYKGNICIFIGGGGSTEIIIVNDKKVLEKRYFSFGVVDITKKFPSLKEDIPTCSFDEVYSYINSQIDDFNIKCDLLILAGGDHFYWYNNANYELFYNLLYKSEKQPKLIPIHNSDKYDRNALETSLNEIRSHSNNPLWFDGSRAMKVTTNVVSHKVGAKYIIPTKINMEDGLREKILSEFNK
jgi:hypothetical protein